MEGSWIGQREKQDSDAVTIEATVDFRARSEAGMTLYCCPVKARSQTSVPTVDLSLDRGCPRGRHTLGQYSFLWLKAIPGRDSVSRQQPTLLQLGA